MDRVIWGWNHLVAFIKEWRMLTIQNALLAIWYNVWYMKTRDQPSAILDTILK